ncbi:hypothetical protein L227DRAFT_616787 [Lentinus tigrinus ALCF2SS1-6]|uniref:Uncharacterized protein n=2 Tax=Lentinus tigrinus TaxID=5365 RepID=A0A5C2RT78_9APHY|nr:hypothetical protein L227DRAFT_616787 [Lentinus tigrinus ALCF2SS1-6]
MVIVGAGPGDILAFDFGRFWDICTYRRWTPQVITYRAGDSGLCLIFPSGTSLDQFEAACDRNLPSRAVETSRPTLEHLRDLGLIAAPKVVGAFLLNGRTEPSCVQRPRREFADDIGNDGDLPFLLTDWTEPDARPLPPLAIHRRGVTGRDNPLSSSALHNEDDTEEETSDSSSIGDLSDLSDLDVTDLDAEDIEELINEVDEDAEAFDVLCCDVVAARRYEFPGSFM